MSRIVRRVAGTPIGGVRLSPQREPRTGLSAQRVIASILRVQRPPEDQWILLPALFLVALGVLMVFSSSALNSLAATDDPYFMGWRQALFAACGLGAMALLSQWDYRRWRSLSTPLLLVAFGLLCAVMVLPTEQGLRRALTVGPISIHAAEVAKLALVLFLADFLSRRGHALAEQSTLLPALLAIGLSFGLVLVEPDLGTATVMAGVGFAVFFTAGAPFVGSSAQRYSRWRSGSLGSHCGNTRRHALATGWTPSQIRWEAPIRRCRGSSRSLSVVRLEPGSAPHSSSVG